MNFEEAMEFIKASLKFGSKLGLSTIEKLLSYMGKPQDKLKFIHIAGTNGKGSTASYISSVLTNAGFKTGLYTSPYVNEFNERIRIDGVNIENDDFARAVLEVKKAVLLLLEEGGLNPTEFELVTAAAFYYFAEQECDFVVLEVGLGGRFDATNIIKAPLVSVITSISFDHTEQLGDTLSKIAFEKCGIIKENSYVVSYPLQEQEALEVIKSTAEQRGCKLFIPNLFELSVLNKSFLGSEFVYNNIDVSLSMVGEHQIYNAVTAIAALEVLRDCLLIPISDVNIADGISKVHFEGRLEVISKNPLVIIDGAHNYSGMAALYNSLKLAEGKKITLIIGMLKDKEYEKSIALIAPLAHKIILTTVPNDRAASTDELLKAAPLHNENVFVRENPSDAVEFAVLNAGEDEIICACGSLYMLSRIKEYFNKE